MIRERPLFVVLFILAAMVAGTCCQASFRVPIPDSLATDPHFWKRDSTYFGRAESIKCEYEILGKIECDIEHEGFLWIVDDKTGRYYLLGDAMEMGADLVVDVDFQILWPEGGQSDFKIFRFTGTAIRIMHPAEGADR